MALIYCTVFLGFSNFACNHSISKFNPINHYVTKIIMTSKVLLNLKSHAYPRFCYNRMDIFLNASPTGYSNIILFPKLCHNHTNIAIYINLSKRDASGMAWSMTIKFTSS